MKKLFLFYAALITLTLPLFSCGDSGNQKSKQDITDSTKQNKQIITMGRNYWLSQFNY